MISDTIYNINVDFDTYENLIEPDLNTDYLKIARNCIGKFANSIYPNLAKEMLVSEDAIAEVAYCIMLGEMKWKEDGGMKLSSWRIEQAKRGIQKYVNRKNRKHNMTTYNSLDPVLASSGQIPNYIERMEDQEYAQVTVGKIMAGSGLTDKEAEAAKLRSEGYTFSQIGDKLKCSDENARLLNNKAIQKMRDYVGIQVGA